MRLQTTRVFVMDSTSPLCIEIESTVGQNCYFYKYLLLLLVNISVVYSSSYADTIGPRIFSHSLLFSLI